MHINSRAIKPPDKENGIAWGQDGVTTSISKSFKWNEQSKGILCGRIFATNKLDSEDGNYYSDQLKSLNVFFVQTKLLQQINRASPTDITSHWEQLISICKFCIKRCYYRRRFTSLIPLNAKNQNVCIRLSWEAWENESKNCVRILLHTLDLTLAKKFQHFEEFVRQ